MEVTKHVNAKQSLALMVISIRSERIFRSVEPPQDVFAGFAGPSEPVALYRKFI